VTGGFESDLDWEGHVRINVRWRTKRRDVVDYSVTLTALERGRRRTIRVYDGAHGVNEMHRYTREGGKQPAIVFHDGTLGEGLQAAQREVKRGWAAMIEGWRR
jgi:hypothetical protein